jgi:hypothetical protein
MTMKKGSLWVLFVVVVFGLMLNITACQKKEAATETPAVTETAPAAPEAMPATTGGVDPAAPAPAGSAQ